MTTELATKPFKKIPPKLYIIKLSHDCCESDAVYLYDATIQHHCCEVTPSYWLEFLYWLPPEGMDYDHPDIDKYLDADNDGGYYHCAGIDAIEEIPFVKILVDDPGENWYKFDDEDDENTEETYNKYIEDNIEYFRCNHWI